MTLDILPGESRGYWKYHLPDKCFKQAKAMGKINNEKALLLLNSGAEMSTLGAALLTLECEGVGNSPYATHGRARVKITLAGNLVYLFDSGLARRQMARIAFLTMSGYRWEIQLRQRSCDLMKLWATLGDRWVPTFVLGPGKKCYLKITNASDRVVWLQEHDRVGMWLAEGRVPRLPGYVLVGSRRHAEWQNLAYQAAADEIDDGPEVVDLPGPL
ncbi:hypothetical protein F442_00763 [Phytophthora nicotianae P10297]|uniref:Peptidase A2 domain-containing protein n=1 Tax=Phytophthora nicotianae P10297 TaxID=1317064 RepID=W3A5R5_PHYNI|nr:hypothetical protein F442_00763 [Phytophthora nicotianae P10297]